MLWVLSKSHGKEMIIQARNPGLVCAKGSSSVLQQEWAKIGFRIVQGSKSAVPRGTNLPPREAPQLSPDFWRQRGHWMSLLGLSFVYWRQAKICKDLATLVFFPLEKIYFLIY